MTPRAYTPTSLDRTIAAGTVVATGTHGTYRQLRRADGEPHVTRHDLAGRHGALGTDSLAHLAHLTDLQLADVQSPGRLEFLHEHVGEPGFERLIPMFRPQELLGVHAVEATVATLNRLGPSPITGAPLQMVISTGDNIDNAQLNELGWYLALLSGGEIDQRTGGRRYEGPQDGTNPTLWSPDHGTGDHAEGLGFPVVPGLIDAALRPVVCSGLALPWLTAYGNHDSLLQGRSAFDERLAAVLTRDEKSVGLPPGRLPDIVSDALRFFAGPTRPITPDPGRRPATRDEFVAAHLEDHGRPVGHGFTRDNLDRDTAYWVHDLEHVRIVTLDTTNPGGHQNGSIGARQLAWLHDRLAEVHRTYLDPRGDLVDGGGSDRLVLVCSHHGSATLTNPIEGGAPGDADPDLPRHLAPEVLALLHRFPNVIGWLSGHVHRHAVIPHPGPTGGFWEVTTAAVMEWPCQVRLVEVVDNSDGTLSLVCTLLDHLAPLRASGLDGVLDLAAWHRELALNDPTSVAGGAAVGLDADRNVELLLPDPLTRA